MKGRLTTAAAALSIAWAGTAAACDDHHGTCEIEDWRWQSPFAGMLMLDGVTTCDEGMVILRLYEGEDGPFLGIANGFISGHAFQAMASDIPKPSALTIKYSIEPR